jgi:hypothetical protein
MAAYLTCISGDNSDLFPAALAVYAEVGPVVDVTYGKGVFWRKVDTSRWWPVGSDLVIEAGTRLVADFTCLPYADRSVPTVVFDPPYMHGGATVKESINKRYHNDLTDHSHAAVIRRYALGTLECERVLRPGGILLVKCQDEIVGSKQQWAHDEVKTMLELWGLEILDLFILHSEVRPAMRHDYQHHARKNHSYLWVARKRGRRRPAISQLP